MVFAGLRPTRSVEYRPVEMRPPRAFHDGRLGVLGVSTHFWDRTPAVALLARSKIEEVIRTIPTGKSTMLDSADVLERL